MTDAVGVVLLLLVRWQLCKLVQWADLCRWERVVWLVIL